MAILMRGHAIRTREAGDPRVQTNAQLRSLVRLESPRTKIATRRLLFVAKMFLGGAPEYPFSLLRSKLAAEGQIDGGKVKTHYLRQIGADLQWLSGVSIPSGQVTPNCSFGGHTIQKRHMTN